ncbi:MAG TPA: hypothetical protein DF364_04025 [Ruminococcaceae bacterium]|nr:hypothetical protein [Oscillospiraceae bacterium]HCU32997.1 hypothetical protein [Oscillospiraceae bacterium]
MYLPRTYPIILERKSKTAEFQALRRCVFQSFRGHSSVSSLVAIWRFLSALFDTEQAGTPTGAHLFY